MPEQNNADGSAPSTSPLFWGFDVVRKVIKGIPTPDVTQLGLPIPAMWQFWGNHNEAGTEVQPEESTEPHRWREVGWIFRQGQCLAIEGKGPEVRARVMVA